MTLRTITEISVAKNGAAELLERAARKLRAPGCEADSIVEALSDATAARLALTGCNQALERMRLGAPVDWKMLQAEGGRS